MSTRVTVPVSIGIRCILVIGVFADSFLNWFAFQMSEFANPVKLRIFSRQIPVNQKSLPVSIGIRCILVIGVFADPFLNRFAFQMSEFANPVKLQIFSCQIPVNQKSLPGIDIRMSQCKFFLVLLNVRNFPKINK